MIRKVRVENYKSILDLTLDLGRVTALIGANGSGKSNILEAIALASAAAQNKLDNEFLISRGIRVTETRFMRSAFDGASGSFGDIRISVEGDNEEAFACELSADTSASYSKLKQLPSHLFERAIAPDLLAWVTAEFSPDAAPSSDVANRWLAYLEQLMQKKTRGLPGFLVYAPENTALRTF